MNEGFRVIEKYQYGEYMRKHRGTPGCGGALMLVALSLLAFLLAL